MTGNYGFLPEFAFLWLFIRLNIILCLMDNIFVLSGGFGVIFGDGQSLFGAIKILTHTFIFYPIFHISEFLTFPSLLAIIHLWVSFLGHIQGFFLRPYVTKLSFLLLSHVNDILLGHRILGPQVFPHKSTVFWYTE